MRNLPSYVVLGTPLADCCGGQWGHGSDYLGPAHAGIRLNADPRNPLPFAAADGRGVFGRSRRSSSSCFRRLNAHAVAEYPADDALRARVKSYELAFRMQSAVPETMRFDEESPATQALYGLDNSTTRPFGQLCLAARRLAERGVRFVQVYHGSNGGCRRVGRPQRPQGRPREARRAG